MRRQSKCSLSLSDVRSMHIPMYVNAWHWPLVEPKTQEDGGSRRNRTKAREIVKACRVRLNLPFLVSLMGFAPASSTSSSRSSVASLYVCALASVHTALTLMNAANFGALTGYYIENTHIEKTPTY